MRFRGERRQIKGLVVPMMAKRKGSLSAVCQKQKQAIDALNVGEREKVRLESQTNND